MTRNSHPRIRRLLAYFFPPRRVTAPAGVAGVSAVALDAFVMTAVGEAHPPSPTGPMAAAKRAAEAAWDARRVMTFAVVVGGGGSIVANDWRPAALTVLASVAATYLLRDPRR